MFHRGTAIRRVSRVENRPLTIIRTNDNNGSPILQVSDVSSQKMDSSKDPNQIVSAFSSAWNTGTRLVDSGIFTNHCPNPIPSTSLESGPEGVLFETRSINPLLGQTRRHSTSSSDDEDCDYHRIIPSSNVQRKYSRTHSTLKEYIPPSDLNECSVLEFPVEHSKYSSSNKDTLYEDDGMSSNCSLSECKTLSVMDMNNSDNLNQLEQSFSMTDGIGYTPNNVVINIENADSEASDSDYKHDSHFSLCTDDSGRDSVYGSGNIGHCISTSLSETNLHKLNQKIPCEYDSMCQADASVKRSSSLKPIKISQFKDLTPPPNTASCKGSFNSIELLTADTINEIAKFSLDYDSCHSHDSDSSSDSEDIEDTCTNIPALPVIRKTATLPMKRPITAYTPILEESTNNETVDVLPIVQPSTVHVNEPSGDTETPPTVPKRTSSLFIVKNCVHDHELIQQAKRLSTMLGIAHEPPKKTIKTTIGKILKNRKLSVPAVMLSSRPSASLNLP